MRWTCFLVWGNCAMWAAGELLWATAVAIPLISSVYGTMSGRWLWTSAVHGYWPLF